MSFLHEVNNNKHLTYKLLKVESGLIDLFTNNISFNLTMKIIEDLYQL